MPSPRNEPALRGLRVWVTRPAHQAGPLSGAIQRAGGVVLGVPLLQIEAVAVDPERPVLGDPHPYYAIIFISANAVSCAGPHLRAIGGLPQGIKVGVIGQATARAVEQSLGRTPDLVPEDRFDSEGLLALPALQEMRDRAVLIVRGDPGREVLAEGLRERGARVDYASVYHRRLVQVDLAAVLDPLPDVIVITSGEVLRHLAALGAQQDQPWIFDKGLVVVHERIRTLARELGFSADIRIADPADNTAVVETLAAWVQ